MKVYVTYWDMRMDGYSMPEVVFLEKKEAVEWCSTRRNQSGPVNSNRPDAEWIELEVGREHADDYLDSMNDEDRENAEDERE